MCEILDFGNMRTASKEIGVKEMDRVCNTHEYQQEIMRNFW